MAFPQARDFSLQNCFFTEIHGHCFNNKKRLDGLEGFKSLCAAAAPNLAYNAEERYPPPRCMAGTRTELQASVHEWLRDPNARPIMWLYGPAGTGKTAIAQTFCETWADNGELLASFFFSADTSSQNTVKAFVPTLAYYIAVSLPPKARAKITEVIELKPGLWAIESITQMRELIIKPLSSLKPRSQVDKLPFVVVIDGIDECGDDDQERILRLILMLAQSKPLQDIGIRIIIASRPEPRIEHRFGRGDLQAWSILRPVHADKKDVYNFLHRELNQLQYSHDHSSILKYLQKPWPDERILQLLTNLSEGHFVYAVTIIRYIKGGICDERLREIIDPTTCNPQSAPFKDLDALYLRILSTCQDREVVGRIFAFLILIKHKIPRSKLRLTSISRVIEILLNLRPGEMKLRLLKLHSILQFTESGEHDDVQFYHTSFQDFLLDQQRSGQWHVDQQAMNAYFFSASLIHVFQSRDAFLNPMDKISTFAWCRAIEVWAYVGGSVADVVEALRIPLSTDCHNSMLLQAAMLWSKDVKCHYLTILDSLFAQIKRDLWATPTDIYYSLLAIVKNTLRCFLLDSCDGDNSKYPQHLRTMQEVGCVQNSTVVGGILTVLGCNSPPAGGINIYFDRRVNKLPILQIFLDDEEIWGPACLPAQRHGLFAHACMSLLNADTFDDTGGAIFCYASQMWAMHLGFAPTGDPGLLSALRRVNIYAAFAFDNDWASLGVREPANMKAARASSWLARSPNSPQDLLDLWDKYASEAFWRPFELP